MSNPTAGGGKHPRLRLVLDGTLERNGEISFARYFKAEDVETLRAYSAHDE